MNDLLNKFEEKHPVAYVITMLITFLAGCAVAWGFAMLVKHITSIL